MDKKKDWKIHLEDVLLKDYRDVKKGLDSEFCRGPDGLFGEALFQWVEGDSEVHSHDDRAQLCVRFPACLCECPEDVEEFARAAFDRAVARIRESHAN